jgi:hypothetical protein
VQFLGSTIDLPAPEDIKRLTVHDKHARRPIGAIFTAAAQRADIDALWTAMDSVGPRVAGLLGNLIGDNLVIFALVGSGVVSTI